MMKFSQRVSNCALKFGAEKKQSASGKQEYTEKEKAFFEFLYADLVATVTFSKSNVVTALRRFLNLLH